MYKVIKYFTDLQDKNHPYEVGDTFPRKGLDVAQERLDELAGKNNKQGVPLILKVEEESLSDKQTDSETVPKVKKPVRKTAVKK